MILETLATITGILMSLAHYPQAYLMFKHKSSHDVSILTYSIFFFGALVWTIYGYYINNWIVFISFVPGFIGSGLVITLALKYRKDKSSKIIKKKA